jgi:uncharacterized linocin/CFP29 family protein
MNNNIPKGVVLNQPVSTVFNANNPGAAFGKFPMASANRLANVLTNSMLSTEEWRELETEVKIAAREQMIGRMLFGRDKTNPLGLGIERYDFDKLSELGEAVSSYGFQETARDIPHKTRATVNLLVHQLDWFINRRTLEATIASGQRMDLATMKGAAYRVAQKENVCLINGLTQDGTNYDESGLYQGAGNSEATSLDYGTVANIVTSINNASSLLKNDNIPEPYQLVLNPTQEGQTRALISGSDKSYYQWIVERIGISGTPGQIFSSPSMTAGTGILMATPGKDWFKHIIGWDLDTWICEVGPMRDLWAKTFIISAVAYYDNNSVCQLTTI